MATEEEEVELYCEGWDKCVAEGKGVSAMRNFYSENADLFEKTRTSSFMQYNFPKVVTEFVKKYIGENKEAKILDVACGTGAGGDELVKNGFTNLDGLDPNKELLQIAIGKKTYKKTYCVLIDPEKDLPFPERTYDMVVSLGGFGPNHIPSKGMYSMVKAGKPGSYMIMMNRDEWLQDAYYEDFESVIEGMENENLARVVEKKVVENSVCGLPATVLVFKIM